MEGQLLAFFVLMIVQAYSMMRTTGISSRGFFGTAIRSGPHRWDYGYRAYSRSSITMGYCHYWNYRPERYGLEENAPAQFGLEGSSTTLRRNAKQILLST
jgi:hypothetical protein